jgi:hypothetical protein
MNRVLEIHESNTIVKVEYSIILVTTKGSFRKDIKIGDTHQTSIAHIKTKI